MRTLLHSVPGGQLLIPNARGERLLGWGGGLSEVGGWLANDGQLGGPSGRVMLHEVLLLAALEGGHGAVRVRLHMAQDHVLNRSVNNTVCNVIRHAHLQRLQITTTTSSFPFLRGNVK